MPHRRLARAVLDTNVLVSAVLSVSGPPRQLVSRWELGELEIVVSELLLVELERTLARPAVRSRLPPDAPLLVEVLRESALLVADPREPAPLRAPDASDDYLIALAHSSEAALVSGDAHLLALARRFPIYSPRAFLDLLEADG